MKTNTLQKLIEKRQEVKEVNNKLFATGNRSAILKLRVSELLAEEYELRFKCHQEGIDHWNLVK